MRSRLKRQTRVLLTLFFIFTLGTTVVCAQVLPVEPPEGSIDFQELDQFISSLDQDIQRLLPGLDFKSWQVTGPNWNWEKAGKDITNYFMRELVFSLRVFAELMLLAMVLAILQNLRHAFESDTVNQLAFGFCYLAVMGIVLTSFSVIFGIARGALTEMSGFMLAIIPLLCSLMVASGGVTTASIVHPVLISSVELVGGLISNIVFPLILFAGILGLTNYLFEGFEVKKLAEMFRNVALGLLGLAMTIFIGVVTIRGFAGSIADTTAMRSAKYLSSTFLPVVGGEIADTMEMAAGCSAVVKGGLGIFGLGLLVLITVFPLVKILAVAMIYQVTGAVMQPLGNNKLADALGNVGGIFMNIFGAVAVVGLMFYIAIAILIGMAGMRVG